MRKKLILFFLVFTHAFLSIGQKETRLIDSLKEELVNSHDTSRTVLLNLLAREYRHYKPDYFLRYTLEAKKLAEKIDYKKGLAFSLFNLGLYNANQGDHKTAFLNYNQALSLTKTFHFQDLQNRIVVARSNSLLDINGNYKVARACYDSILKIAVQRKDYSLQTDALDRIACIFHSAGVYDSATSYDIRALEFAEKTKDSMMIGRIMINLGLGEATHGDTAKAMEYYQGSLAIATKIKNKMVATYCLLNIACIWMDKKENQKAVDYFLKALALAKDLDYKNLIISLNIHLGYAYFAMGNYDGALNYYMYAYEHEKNNKELLDFIRILNAISSVYKEKKDYTKAISFLEQAREANKNGEYKEELSDTYARLAQVYAEQKDFKSAYHYHLLYKTIDSSIFNTQREISKNEITAKYQTEKKTKEILVLKKNNEIKDLQLSNNRIIIIAAIIILVLAFAIFLIFYNKFKIKKKANEEKEVMLREIHHRVKNNLQIILSILNIQARKTNDQKIINFIKESESRIQAMAIIHEKLYQSDNLASISFNEYIVQLIEFIFTIYNVDKEKINYALSATDIHLDINTAVPLGLIINELVCNSLKHGFINQERGTIFIQLKRLEPKEYELTIGDTGNGLPENFDIKNTTSLGLKLIQTLTRQLEGKLQIGGETGAMFSIYFKEIS